MLTADALQRVEEIPGHKTVYILAGIAELLTTLTSADGYKETIFEDNGLFPRICDQLQNTEYSFKSLNCHIVFCTIASMSLKEYNRWNLEEGITHSLKFHLMYPEMQERLHHILSEVNNVICNLNNGQKLLTPLVHSYINKRSSRKEKTIYRLNKLEDGLNPDKDIIRCWKHTMNKIIYRNQKVLAGVDFGIPLCKIEITDMDMHRERGRDRSKDRNRDRERDRHRSRDRTRSRSRDRGHGSSGDRDKDRDRIRDRDIDRDRIRDRDIDRDRIGDRDRDRIRERDKDGDRIRDRDRTRHRDMERDSRIHDRDRNKRNHDIDRDRDSRIYDRDKNKMNCDIDRDRDSRNNDRDISKDRRRD